MTDTCDEDKLTPDEEERIPRTEHDVQRDIDAKWVELMALTAELAEQPSYKTSDRASDDLLGDDWHRTERQPCPEYTPTRQELAMLVGHWVEYILERKLYWFWWGDCPSSDAAEVGYANDRLSQIASIIGEERVLNLEQEASAKQRKKMGEHHWNIFTEGSMEDWKKVAEESWNIHFAERAQETVAEAFPGMSPDELAQLMRLAADRIEHPSAEMPLPEQQMQGDAAYTSDVTRER